MKRGFDYGSRFLSAILISGYAVAQDHNSYSQINKHLPKGHTIDNVAIDLEDINQDGEKDSLWIAIGSHIEQKVRTTIVMYPYKNGKASDHPAYISEIDEENIKIGNSQGVKRTIVSSHDWKKKDDSKGQPENLLDYQPDGILDNQITTEVITEILRQPEKEKPKNILDV